MFLNYHFQLDLNNNFTEPMIQEKRDFLLFILLIKLGNKSIKGSYIYFNTDFTQTYHLIFIT